MSATNPAHSRGSAQHQSRNIPPSWIEMLVMHSPYKNSHCSSSHSCVLCTTYPASNHDTTTLQSIQPIISSWHEAVAVTDTHCFGSARDMEPQTCTVANQPGTTTPSKKPQDDRTKERAALCETYLQL
ncbi:hypothetical protein HBH56_220640 [Parastagonospora nodorum]|uniref:Uncharacterized protein n=1 Tax=Phaeosphaeria nodorum (strain SN15 / ATCC MYA-4574 / FGSC 10173) TaxID=321614 RepID=A0A7U2I0E3_PHANO|nr:hypothetical protein HBH56_220640 [Parastagonospora nodorum]QRC97109.1 hypothetical protein JI435_410120 [Parastagonospora nodorum SN15]KAH3924059.1 hypothetical protein HBH54_201090 [Parastagonospora nodorum]KAH4046226.1 hypothetical protein HBH49_187270 [Parastagonospora nodorum]KAH4104798.1 hypothetical protein HBH46_093820 [Parastagonospora nodorum]